MSYRYVVTPVDGAATRVIEAGFERADLDRVIHHGNLDRKAWPFIKWLGIDEPWHGRGMTGIRQWILQAPEDAPDGPIHWEYGHHNLDKPGDPPTAWPTQDLCIVELHDTHEDYPLPHSTDMS